MRHSLHRLQLDIPRQTTTDCTAQSPKKKNNNNVPSTSAPSRDPTVSNYNLYTKNTIYTLRFSGSRFVNHIYGNFRKEKSAALHSHVRRITVFRKHRRREGGGEGGAVHIDEEFARTLFKSAPKQNISNKRKSWAHNLR